MSAQSLTTTVLANQLTAALAQDGLPCVVGPHTVGWLCSVAEALCLYQELGAQELITPGPDLLNIISWAYGRLHQTRYTRPEDLLMLDRMKMLLEHGLH